MSRITELTLYNNRNQSVLDGELFQWKDKYPNDNNAIFGPVIRYAWLCDGEKYEINSHGDFVLCILPDYSGFICFLNKYSPDNCVLVDSHGKLFKKLRVPFELTGRAIPPDAEMWFRGISGHLEGTFGVSAWIEGSGSGGYAEGDWYFELDYHKGEFLWGKEIRM